MLVHGVWQEDRHVCKRSARQATPQFKALYVANTQKTKHICFGVIFRGIPYNQYILQIHKISSWCRIIGSVIKDFVYSGSSRVGYKFTTE